MSVKNELLALTKDMNDARKRTEAVLKRVCGDQCTLQFLTMSDRRLLTVLLVWERKYKIDLEWIAETLLRHYTAKRAKTITGRQYRFPGLPVRAATLVGETSRSIIVNTLAVDFPNRENETVWRGRERTRFIQLLQAEQKVAIISPFTSTWMDFPDIETYAKAYARHIGALRHQLVSIREEWQKHGKPYRGSPWK